MHNPDLMISVMEKHRREYAHLHRHDWKRPVEPKPESKVRRAVATLAALRPITWSPMTPAEAGEVLAHEPPAIGIKRGESGRYVEAWMVRSGASPARTKAVLELVRSHPV